jgi:uncharacterized membrane protein YphA (DoxX/SURF4 family)
VLCYLRSWGKTLGMMKAKGIPFAEVALLITIVLVLGGGLMILIGSRVRWAAPPLSLWMIPATFYFHAFWTYPPEHRNGLGAAEPRPRAERTARLSLARSSGSSNC